MPAFVARQRAESALRFLPQKTDWMEPFHIGNHLVILREYVDHVEKDNVLMQVAAGMRRRLAKTGKEWFDESNRAGAPLPFPEDAIACFCLRYDLMRAVRMEKQDLRYFVSNHYKGAHLNEMLMNWKRAVVHPFAWDMKAFSKLLLARLPEGEGDGQWIDLEPLVQAVLDELRPVAFGRRSWTDQDDENPPKIPDPAGSASSTPAPAKVASPPDSLEGAIEGLARTIAQADGLSPDERHDLGIEARIISLEARKTGDRTRLESRLQALSGHAPLAAAVEVVKQRLGQAASR